MNKCDFCDLGKECQKNYFETTVKQNCRASTDRMMSFLLELVEKGAKVQIG